MRSFSNQGVMYLAVEMMLLRRPQARGQYQPVQVIKARHVAELEQVEVHFTVLENVKLVYIVRIGFDFLFNKTSDEISSTNGDAKTLKPRHCEYFMIVLRVQEGTQGLQGRIALDKVCCPLFEVVKGHILRQDLSLSDCQFQACVLLENMFDFRKIFRTTLGVIEVI